MAKRCEFTLDMIPGYVPLERIILAYRRGDPLSEQHKARLRAWAESEPYVVVRPAQGDET